MGKGNSSNFKIGWHRGDWVPGAFKLDHLQPFKPILLWNFSNFWLSCPRAHFLYSPGKWEKGILPTQRGFSAWGIPTGPWKGLLLPMFNPGLQRITDIDTFILDLEYANSVHPSEAPNFTNKLYNTREALQMEDLFPASWDQLVRRWEVAKKCNIENG